MQTGKSANFTITTTILVIVMLISQGCASGRRGAADGPSPVIQGQPGNATLPANSLRSVNNLPEDPMSPVNNGSNAFPTANSSNNGTAAVETNSDINRARENMAETEEFRRDSKGFRAYRVYPKKINVFERANPRSRVVGWLKRNNFVQARIDGRWAELRGTGFIETRHLFPSTTRPAARRFVAKHRKPPARIARSSGHRR